MRTRIRGTASRAHDTSRRTLPSGLLLLLLVSLASAACRGTTSPGPPDGDARAGDDVPAADGSDPDVLSTATCDFGALPSRTTPAASAADWPVGDFRVTIGASGSLDVRHVSEPGRSLFALPAGMSALNASLDLVGDQGGVRVGEAIAATCSATGPATVRTDGRNVVASGPLSGGDASCTGATWELRLCEPLPGHLRMEAGTAGGGFGAIGFAATLEDDDRVVGLGEQFLRSTLDLRGRTVPVVVREQGIGRGEPSITEVMEALSPGSSGDERCTYAPIPHVMTRHARSFLLQNDEPSVFDVRDAIAVRAYADPAVVQVLHGRDPKELLERLTETTGRMPEPPAWLDGGAVVALASDFATNLSRLDALLAAGAAISAAWTQTWCGTTTTVIGSQVTWNWVAQDGWAEHVNALAQRGVRALCYVNPMFRDVAADDAHVRRNLYREVVDRGLAVRDGTGAPYRLKQGVFDVVLLDLSNPDARTWMKDVLKDELLGAGCSGWMADFGEALPFDAVLASGEPALSWHDRYPVEWARLNREAVQEAGRDGDVLVFHRSGFLRTPAYAPMMWEGDQTVTWDAYDGLASAMHGLLNGGFSGLALNHSDAGGYTTVPLVDPPVQRSPELLMRWVELGAFTTLLRTHEGNRPGDNAQVYSDDVVRAHFARFSKVHRALAPLRRSLFGEAAAHGWPVARPLPLHHPDLPRAWDVADEFLLGPDVLVAPVLEPCADPADCAVDRAVWLPPGDWVHLWTGAHTLAGDAGRDTVVHAPLGQPPVFWQAGSDAGTALVQALRSQGLDVPAQ